MAQSIPERWDGPSFPRAVPWVTMLLEQGLLVQVDKELSPIQPGKQ